MDEAFLLDTHTLIWWWLGDPSLSRGARSLLETRQQRIYVSPVAGIEIALKVRAGKLPVLAEILEIYDQAVAADGFLHLPIDWRHAIDAGLLGGDHRDPFDRLIAAQALAEGMAVVTRDREIASFGCKTIW